MPVSISLNMVEFKEELYVRGDIMASIEELRTDLREMLSDAEPELNLLLGKKQAYSDTRLDFFLKMAIRDLNAGSPRTNYTLETFPDPNLIVMGAMIQAFIAEGVLQLRNQIDYNDAGLAINLFGKTGQYQGWAGFLLQTYLSSKLEFKRGVLSNSFGAGFIGIGSQFDPDWGCWQ